jgi:uncharacterized protein (TIGR02145 family)
VSGTITVVPPGANQPQGSCTFTQPPVINTFTAFPATYSASTFVTLVDERDGNNYTVVKMPDGKWWMAQNLNYQGTTQGSGTFSLHWNQYCNQANDQPFTTGGAGTLAIGSFWCPAGTDGAKATVSSANRAGCTLYGAFYSWETAMMVDGMWSDEAHSSSTYAEPTGEYATNTTSGNTNNNARGVTKRGICPPNWHVPTDAEWGNMFNLSGTKGTDYHNGYNTWLGINNDAGETSPRLKATCTCPSNNSGCVNDTKNNWLYSTTSAHRGTDVYGFRAVPAGHLNEDGNAYWNRGHYALWYTSSATDNSNAIYYMISSNSTTLSRSIKHRSNGDSVRCVRD